jgi:hypothetical protein
MLFVAGGAFRAFPGTSDAHVSGPLAVCMRRRAGSDRRGFRVCASFRFSKGRGCFGVPVSWVAVWFPTPLDTRCCESVPISHRPKTGNRINHPIHSAITDEGGCERKSRWHPLAPPPAPSGAWSGGRRMEARSRRRATQTDGARQPRPPPPPPPPIGASCASPSPPPRPGRRRGRAPAGRCDWAPARRGKRAGNWTEEIAGA